MHPVSINKIENGAGAGRKSLVKISRALGCTLEDLHRSGGRAPAESPPISAQLEAVAEMAVEKVLSRKVPGLSPAKQRLVDLIASGVVTDARADVLFEMLSVESASVAPDEVEPAPITKRR